MKIVSIKQDINNNDNNTMNQMATINEKKKKVRNQNSE